MRSRWSAAIFDAWVAVFQRWSPREGVGIRLQLDPDGTRISIIPDNDFDHPWALHLRWQPDAAIHPKPPGGQWRATITPGFVVGGANVIDAHVTMPALWSTGETVARDVPLTDEIAPWLTLPGFRDPIRSAGGSPDPDTGDIVFAAGSGYPPYFATRGVRPPASGGKTGDLTDDPTRTRELRAVDVVLRQPRIGTKLDVGVDGDPEQAQVQNLTTVYVNDILVTTGGRARLIAEAQFVPLDDGQTVPGLFDILLNGGDPQFDDILIATVWMLSPPNADFDAVPDQTWTPYAQNFVWWNLNHATRLVPPATLQAPILLTTGIPLADLLANPLIEISNDVLNEVDFAVGQADTRGMFWST